MLNDISLMEANLADKYGEDFAENLAAEHLDKETYMKIMAIEDQEERRDAIAEALLDGIENGTIDPDTLNGDIRSWLDAKEQAHQTQELESARSNSVLNNDLVASNTEESTLDNLFASKP